MSMISGSKRPEQTRNDILFTAEHVLRVITRLHAADLVRVRGERLGRGTASPPRSGWPVGIVLPNTE